MQEIVSNITAFKNLAFRVLLQALEDYRRDEYKSNCMSFLESDVFTTCCSILDLDEDKTREKMIRYYGSDSRFHMHMMRKI